MKKPSEIRAILDCLRQEQSSGVRVKHVGSGSREAMRRAAMTATPSCSTYAGSIAIRGTQIMFPFLQKCTFRFPDKLFFDFLPATGLHVYYLRFSPDRTVQEKHWNTQHGAINYTVNNANIQYK